jgi:sugar phosphate isomerase/epimerase
LKGLINECGLEITELSTHLQGQLVAVHPAYNELFDGFAPDALKGNYKARTEWAVQQVKYAAKASQNMGITAHATFSGALLWPYWHPWPQQPAGLLDEGFNELARRWKPILDYFDECGVDACYEIHPGEDLHDGVTYELFLEKLNNHPRACLLYDPSHFVLQQLDYVSYIDHYHERIKAFHVKDAEFRPNGKQGAFGGYQNWANRAGRYRSLGDGQVDFKRIFSKLTQYDYDGWAVMEWECVLKHPEDGAREGAAFIRDHIIRVTERAFDDFAGSGINAQLNRTILGLD